MTRLRCRLFGCRLGRWEGPCVRCGRDIYDHGFVERNAIEALARWWRGFRAGLWPRCEHCGRRLSRRRPAQGWARFFCSEKCCNSSVPF